MPMTTSPRLRTNVPIVRRSAASPAPIYSTAVARPSRLGPVVRLLLVGTGLAGLALAAIGASMFASFQPDGLATAVDRTLVAAERSATDAAVAVDGAATAGNAASDVARRLGEASSSAGRSLDVELFGVRPLGPAVVEFERLGEQSRALAAELDIATVQSGAAAEDLRDLATELATLSALGRATGDSIETGAWRWLAYGLLGWIAVQSVVFLVLAARLR
jgi:hypothetical protein